MAKKLKVEIEGDIKDANAARSFVEEIANQYADLEVSDINIKQNSLTFNISAPGMDDLTPADVKFRIDEFISMNVPPFNIKKISVH